MGEKAKVSATKTVWLLCQSRKDCAELKRLLEQEGYSVFLPSETNMNFFPPFALLFDCPLSEKERAILQIIADEGSIKGAAKRLKLKSATIHKHLRSINAALNAKSTLHAIVIAMRKGFIH